MPAQENELQAVSLALRTARANQAPIQPPSKTWPTLDAEDGFKIQQISTEHAVQNGDRLVGYKLGNIAKVMQDAFGLDHPDYGFLLASTFVYESTTIRRKDYIKPYVELEPAFVLRGPLKGPNITVADVMNAIDYAIPAIEIIDSRVQNWEIGLADTLADNGSTGAVILGGTPKKLTELTLRDTRAWLVNRLAAYDIEFQPGQVILPGSCLQAVPMEEAGHWKCTFEGWGTVEFDVV
ncbi:hypothetical protein APSETT444_005180 [Aspergillus pseudonomiae]